MKTKYIYLLFILTIYFILILSDETYPYVIRIKSRLFKGFGQEGSMAVLGIPYQKLKDLYLHYLVIVGMMEEFVKIGVLKLFKI